MPTIRDVARRAGVSVSTVSAVLNKNKPVSSELAARVEAAVRELRYRPSGLARSLSLRRSRLVGLVVPSIVSPFYPPLIAAVEETLDAAGYALLLADSAESAERERTVVEALRGRGIDGLLLAPAAAASSVLVDELVAEGLPLVLVARRVAGVPVDTVVCDNHGAARQATEHLIAQGRRRIAFLNLTTTISTARDRLEGYCAALRAAGLPVDERLVTVVERSEAAGRAGARALLQQEPRPDALIACNQLSAVGALAAAAELGLRVPQDLAVVGYDDFPWTARLAPPLTVVAQPIAELGRTAATRLLRQLEREGRAGAPELFVLPTTLITRASSGSANP